jgi:antibiotic biosynthesis monooxygenase (ABM) superfamily enzyme
LQNKADPVLNDHANVSVTTLMATIAADLVVVMGKRCLLVLDAYFAVGLVFKILRRWSTPMAGDWFIL